MAAPSKCIECANQQLVTIETYKRTWYLCEKCGTGFPVQKDKYIFQWAKTPELRKQEQDEQSIYDYFVRPDNIALSTSLVGEFIERYTKPYGVEFAGKRVLDVSGGNGHFAKGIEALGASMTLTEINQRAIDYAREAHGFPVHEFNFNKHRLPAIDKGPWDIVMLRAAIMFCMDLDQLAADLAQVVAPGGLVIINHSVMPTLGVLLRVQLDEFSYFALRQPETIIGYLMRHGFDVHTRADETDPTLYAYDYDLKDPWMFARAVYEIPAARKLRAHRHFAFPARDRRRSTMILRRQG